MTFQQLQNVTLNQIRNDPTLGLQVAQAYGSPEVYQYWISGARSFDSDKAYTLSNIQSNVYPLTQLVNAYGNWNNPANAADSAASTRKRQEALTELQHMQQVMQDKYGIDFGSLPEVRSAVTRLGGTGSTPVNPETAQQAAANQVMQFNSSPVSQPSGNNVSPPTTGTPGSPAPAGGSTGDGMQMNYDDVLADIYAQRPDLQALYGPDGRALNPQDPKVAGIPTILDWAQNFGPQEYPQLQGFTAAAVTGGGGAGGTGPKSDTGDPNLDALLTEIYNKYNGQQLNPDAEITPELAKQFLDEASKRISPYFTSQIALIRNDLDRNLGDLQTSYNLQRQQDESKFKQNLGSRRESLAGNGLAFSGVRGQQEGQMVADQNLQSATQAASASSKASGAILSTEQKIGSRNLTSLTMPNLTEYQASTEGAGGFNAGRTLNFDTTGNVTGDLEYQRSESADRISNLLRGQYIEKVSRTGNRTLNFN